MPKNLPLILTFCLIVAVSVSAQVSGSHQRTLSSTHGLKLILQRDPLPNALGKNTSPQDPERECLANHPLLACTPLAIVLKNEGTDTILRWFSSCPSNGVDVRIEIQNGDRGWQIFPQGELIVCSRNVLGVQSIAPGKSYEYRLRLADPGLQLDTELPNALNDYHQSLLTNTRRGYALLTGQGSPVIRAVWKITGCIAAQTQRGSAQELDPFVTQSLCVESNQQEQGFILLQSNELKLETTESAR